MQKGVLFHIDENDKWELLLNNVKNLLAASRDPEEYAIEVLANGEAVSFYAEHAKAGRKLEELAKLNVSFVACSHSLTGMGIGREMLLPFIKIVPAGVLEIVQRQNEGYAYIKP